MFDVKVGKGSHFESIALELEAFCPIRLFSNLATISSIRIQGNNRTRN
jgi:hypothetical protein